MPTRRATCIVCCCLFVAFTAFGIFKVIDQELTWAEAVSEVGDKFVVVIDGATDALLVVVDAVWTAFEIGVDTILDFLDSLQDTIFGLPFALVSYVWSTVMYFAHPLDAVIISTITKYENPGNLSEHMLNLEGHFNCKHQMRRLKCIYTFAASEEDAAAMGANAALYVAPRRCHIGHRISGSKLTRVLLAPVDRPSNCTYQRPYMEHFDVEMSYHTCSQVHLSTFHLGGYSYHGLFEPAKSFNEKTDTVAYLTDECQVSNVSINDVTFVNVLSNTFQPQTQFVRTCTSKKDKSRINLLQNHKFCLIRESANYPDYISNFLWDALAAGCVPVYAGAPNVASFLPSPQAAIIAKSSQLEALTKQILILSNDEFNYNKLLLWKRSQDEGRLPPDFRNLARSHHPQCELCQLLAGQRSVKRTFATCLWNPGWLERTGVKV